MQTVPRENRPTLNIKGTLIDLSTPVVMGILNVTPDSFYAASRCQAEDAVIRRARQIIDEGGTIIDVGAYSSRPNATDIPEKEEIHRLDKALSAIRKTFPDVFLSVDTFRASVSKMCIENYGVEIINDISGGELDKEMFATVAQYHTAYILMHMRGTPQDMGKHVRYENLVAEILQYFAQKTARLRSLGVCDIIIDPGFGFSKTLDDNYRLLNALHHFTTFDMPILAGVSRKSMIYNLLGTTPEGSLNGTSVLNTLALLGGSDILRVHDVKEAVETVKIVTKTLMEPKPLCKTSE